MAARIIVPARVRTFDAHGEVAAGPDRLAGEEPLEVRLNGEQFTVTMRTPGDDFELVTGLLLSEAVITRISHVVKMDYRSGVDQDGHRTYNVVDVRLAPDAPGPQRGEQRQVFTSSSCGVCGTPSLDSVLKPSAHPVAPSRPLVAAARIVALPDELREHQRVFDATGGVHAAALFLSLIHI